MWSSTPAALASNSEAIFERTSKSVSASSAMRVHVIEPRIAAWTGLGVRAHSTRARGHAPTATAHRNASIGSSPDRPASACRAANAVAYGGSSEPTNGTTYFVYMSSSSAGVRVRKLIGSERSSLRDGDATIGEVRA